MYYIYGVICHRLTSPLTFTVKQLANCTENIIIIHVDKKLGKKEFNLMKKCFSSLSNVLTARYILSSFVRANARNRNFRNLTSNSLTSG